MPEIVNDVGKQLRKWRRDLDLSQTTVAEAIGLSVSQVSGIEQGKRKPPGAEILWQWMLCLDQREMHDFQRLVALSRAQVESVTIELKRASASVRIAVVELQEAIESGRLTDDNADRIIDLIQGEKDG